MVRLQECELDADMAWSYPMIHERPEEAWTASLEAETLPRPVFDFYCAANFFSLGRAPAFLADPERILFSYLKALVNGVREAFEDASELLKQLRISESNSHSPIKELKGEQWDPKAAQVSRRTFKYLLMEMAGVLDQTAEVVALLLFGQVGGLAPGRADFKKLVRAVREWRPTSAAVLTPREAQREKLFEVLARALTTEGPEADWFDLFSLYRNKTAHIGNYMFPSLGLVKKDAESCHTFLPNRWPVFMEQHASVGKPGKQIDLSAFFASEFIHQDRVEYAEGLFARIQKLTADVFAVLLETYRLFADFPAESGAVEALKRQEEQWRFQFFDVPAGMA